MADKYIRGLRGLTTLAGCCLAAVAAAHHSFPAVYDVNARTTIEGVVTEVLYQNPHARVYLRVVGGDGTEQIWELETQNTSFLRRGGWLPDSVQVGDRLTVEGNLAFEIEKRLYIQIVTQEDGNVLWVQDPGPLREEGFR
ncbi:DUF6152 family protein [Candidatus Rariloculus sp.]|uniref:DUF6152 family protein n=1 Tax=Candidatus Rariloculus sp. TaxID=3101265 RepID=UPI003D097926